MRSGSLTLELLVAGFALAVLVALPHLVPSKAFMDFAIRAAAFAVFATSLNLLVGYAGMVSFGHGMFFGLGAYAFGLLMQRTGLPIPVALVLAVGIVALAAALVGAICVRLKEIYFAFLTLAFQMLLYSLIVSWVPLTGGDQGLLGGIPRPRFLGIELANQIHLYTTACVLMVLCLLAMRQIAQSSFGYTLRLIRDNPGRAAFLGINVPRIRLAVFVMAGAFASIGGIIMSLFVSGAYPEFGYWTTSGEAIFMIMLGGMNAFLGPAVGAALLLLLNDVVTKTAEYYGLTLGIVILLFALGLRKGLLDFVLDAIAARKRRAYAAAR